MSGARRATGSPALRRPPTHEPSSTAYSYELGSGLGNEIADSFRAVMIDRCSHWIWEEQPEATGRGDHGRGRRDRRQSLTILARKHLACPVSRLSVFEACSRRSAAISVYYSHVSSRSIFPSSDGTTQMFEAARSSHGQRYPKTGAGAIPPVLRYDLSVMSRHQLCRQRESHPGPRATCALNGGIRTPEWREQAVLIFS